MPTGLHLHVYLHLSTDLAQVLSLKHLLILLELLLDDHFVKILGNHQRLPRARFRREKGSFKPRLIGLAAVTAVGTRNRGLDWLGGIGIWLLGGLKCLFVPILAPRCLKLGSLLAIQLLLT